MPWHAFLKLLLRKMWMKDEILQFNFDLWNKENDFEVQNFE